MSEIQITFTHHAPKSFNCVNIYRSPSKNYRGKLIQSIPKSRVARQGNLFVCRFEDKKIGIHHYNVSVAVGRFESGYRCSKYPLAIFSSIKTFELKVDSIYNSSIHKLTWLEKSLKNKISQKFSYLKRKM